MLDLDLVSFFQEQSLRLRRIVFDFSILIYFVYKREREKKERERERERKELEKKGGSNYKQFRALCFQTASYKVGGGYHTLFFFTSTKTFPLESSLSDQVSYTKLFSTITI